MEGATNIKGEPIAKEIGGAPRELTPKEITGVALGFRPSIVAKYQEYKFLRNQERNYWTARRSELKAMYWEAVQSKEREAVEDVQASISRFNVEIPDQRLRVTGKELRQYAREHQAQIRKEARDQSPQRFRKMDRRLMELMKEGGNTAEP